MEPIPVRHGRLALVALAAMLAPGLLGALELGAARINSAAGAPLSIDIPLLDVQPGALDTLRPSLPASSRSAALASASIERGEGPAGEPVLRIRSPQPLPTGELRFVVVADWGRGRRFREYLLSVDAPTSGTATNPPAAVGRPAPSDEGSAALPAPTVTTLATSSGAGAGLVIESAGQSSPESATVPVPAAATLRKVRAGETLMSISRELSAATGATLAQSMVGIYRANPQAFGRGGMSELLVDAELNLPDAAALGVTSPRAASSEVSRTLGIWRTGGDARSPGAAGTGESTTLSTSPAPQPPPPVVRSAAAAAAPAASKLPASAPAAASGPAPAPLALNPAAATATSVAVPAAPAADTSGTTAADPALTADQRVVSLEGQLADKSADLEAARLEVEALKTRVAAAEAALAAERAATRPAGWLGMARQWAAAAWWSIPALAVLSLLLLVLLVLVVRAKGRRPAAATAAETVPAEPRREMSVDLPPINPKREAALPADALLQDIRPAAAAPTRTAAPAPAPAPAATPPPVRTVAPSAAPMSMAAVADLEGDPPPVDEAGSKINLARAFMEMGDHDAAILELQAVLRVGDERQRAEAIRLLDSMPKS
jgi:pilus assembly protein FimV